MTSTYPLVDAALCRKQPAATAILLATDGYTKFFIPPVYDVAVLPIRIVRSTPSFRLSSVLNALPHFFSTAARRVVHRRCNSLCGAKCVNDKSISVGRKTRRFMYPLHFLKVRLDTREFVKRFQGRSPRPRREMSLCSPFDDGKANCEFFLTDP